MPPRKMQKTKHKSRISKNQKSAIVTRLLQISLEVDRYIYKGCPISTNSAQLYIDEVNGCKDKCWNDERSLQVIEKLDRLLKGIIREQQELHDVNNDAINQFNDSTNSDATTVVNTLENNNLTEIGTNIPTTNLNTTTTRNVDNSTVNPDSDTQMKTDISNKKEKEKTADSLGDKSIKQRHNKNKNSETSNNKLERNLKPILKNGVNITRKTNVEAQPNIPEHGHNAVKPVYDKDNGVNITRKTNVEAQPNIPEHGHNAVKPVYDKDIILDNTIHNIEPKTKAPKPEMANIVNINTTDDLTWIENLRHVREISEEEKIPLLNDESFWENLTLANDY